MAPIKHILLAFFIIGAVACSNEPPTQSAAKAHHDPALPLTHRLALMSGHVEAGLALYRAGEPDMAAPHLLHPVSETHAAEREGINAYGFDGALFETVSTGLEEGRRAEEIEPQLQAAEANLASVAEKAGGDPAEIIAFLMDNVIEEYKIAVKDGIVTDAGEYQDAYGFSIVARSNAEALTGAPGEKIRAALDALLALWPAAPIPPSDPVSIETVKTHIDAVHIALGK